MGNTVEDLRTQILSVRQDLRHNLHAVEDRVKTLVDWRQTYRSHAGVILAGAAIGGFLLAHHLASKKPGATVVSYPMTHGDESPVGSHVRHTVAEIQTALVNAAAGYAKRLLGKWIPGFADNLPHP